jgi:hypothetical protein
MGFLLALAACISPPCGVLEGPVLKVDWRQTQAHWNDPDPTVFSSIGEALSWATEGTTVCLAPGNWTEQIVMDTSGVTLAGSGIDRTTLLSPKRWREDTDGRAIVSMAANDLVLQDLSVEGGDRGVQVLPHARAHIQRVNLRGSQIGLSADDPLQLTVAETVFEGHSKTAAVFTGEGGLAVQMAQVTFRDNGYASTAEAGAIVSELPIRLVDAFFRRNAGTRASDLMIRGGLEAERLDLLGALTPGGPPKMNVYGALRLSGVTIETRGTTAILADCMGRDAWIENLAIIAAGDLWPTDSLVITDCNGQLAHTTMAHVDGGPGEIGLVLRGYGDFAVSNSVFVGFETALLTKNWWGDLRTEAVFTGSIEDAGLLHASAHGADLRPQINSPLIDAGIALDVRVDREGRPRPQGAAPDIGAYERR